MINIYYYIEKGYLYRIDNPYRNIKSDDGENLSSLFVLSVDF